MIKAIFLDIDGTLISGKRPSIKKEVIEGLKQVRKKGIQLFIASGRHMLELEELKLVEQFEFDGYLLLNGGYCTIGSQIKQYFHISIPLCKIEYMKECGLSLL